ncbi:endonuclease domain-containing 1 protein-like isoform X2 [Chanodichthys erythropterus]|uniref:endonuclease domain-containing 1 protein-like isoform X2 n=1 Tax=Chanodichthys erythropterus TaxID=933992 RepID=UPI00351EE68F
MTLFLHVLMLFLLSGGSAEVVQTFEQECGQFFAGGKSPTTFTGSRYMQICQNLNGVVYYATYYDTDNKIPVYSAYRFAGRKDCTRLDKWYIEPQLDDNNQQPNMKLERDVVIPGLGVRQALNGDYEKSGYDRGHLAPVYQAQSQSCSDATFTLANAAPQNPSFNRGVVPGTQTLKNRVNVPSHFWTAYCCLDQNNRCQISKGFIGVNKNIPPQSKSVNALETELAKYYNVNPFKLFNV